MTLSRWSWRCLRKRRFFEITGVLNSRVNPNTFHNVGKNF
jgi:hypothetical protein